MATPLETSVILAGDEIRPYRIHVSSKYLDLTKQKLELTRLPHETVEPKSQDWWEPKQQIEPLIDFWLEKYDWREQERLFNAQLPQFRTAVSIPGSESSIRLHFIHVRSPHDHAVPLLLIPPFPFTNLSLGHLIQPFTEPENPETQQPFHLVIPSLPGLGFSDALPSNTPVISAAAEILNVVMSRLSYTSYLVSNTASAASSPAEIDWKLANYLATHYSGSCAGAHFINPSITAPTLKEAPLEWMKWTIAKLFRAPVLGYQNEDFRSLDRVQSNPESRASKSSPKLGPNTIMEPNTPSFALCDSPVGLLALVLKVIRILGTTRDFSPTEIITFTQTAWLPGPEAAMRFWAHCLAHDEKQLPKPATKPRVAITVFSGDDGGTRPPDAETRTISPRPAPSSYACPAWANVLYNVVHTHRAPGNPGLVAWDSPEHILDGIRGLSKGLLSIGSKLKTSSSQPGTEPLQGVVIQSDSAPAPGSNQAVRTPGPTEVMPSTPQAEASWRLERIREASETPGKSQKDGGGADADFDQASPDTIVVTPPGN
ncbi:putative epoxide hydrolase [Colletotrichum truncatum]|uniref:Epoxide hydrolase n=1 Tax=Colletotrichum truncatum TaxID=5467 RepID=A0ACC3ZIK4_COLTU|nr:putative epoxide hydrolase [Colletotrichum truncatum]KAF6791767.1 putative epoxide hydrolase [Colletotrichum truncatum]